MCQELAILVMTQTLCTFLLGDHFYKKNSSLSLEDQMISAMPDIKSVSVTGDDEFIIFACDGIWYATLYKIDIT